MIYITGDCHADFNKLTEFNFPEQETMKSDEENYVIVCGDFGGVWNMLEESVSETYTLDWLNTRPFIVLFVDGNHENFDRLNAYPIKEWHGGKVHEIRPRVLHLMRGEIFEIEGKTFFAFGGASSHDIEDGIVPFNDNWKQTAAEWYYNGKSFRIDHVSWWKEELPDEWEKQNAIDNLKKYNNTVDYIITHCASTEIQHKISRYFTQDDPLTEFFDTLRQGVEYRYWFFGHYHDNRKITKKDILLYEQILPL